MNLEQKLRELKKAATVSARDRELERQLEYLRRFGEGKRTLPAHRAPKGIEEYVEGRIERNAAGEFFLAEQALPFGRPYGKLRIGDISTADFRALEIFLENDTLPESSKLLYLDTETTGLAGGTGTCAFLIGVGRAEGSRFVLRQFFLRDYPEEKAVLGALADALAASQGVVTFNGKTFDIPLLETRYALARLKSPFTRLVHLDLLHPARRLWKLRLESCALTHLEKEVLGVGRQGDVDGSEIPGIYFDYLRTGDARGLEPVFYHNALDIITLAALAVEIDRAIASGRKARPDSATSGLDLFSLSRIFDRARAPELSVSACERALAAGLPEEIETRALWHLARQHKRRRQYEPAASLWLEIARRETQLAIHALEELAIHCEHRCRDPKQALAYTEAALDRLDQLPFALHAQRFTRRRARLKRKVSVPI